MLSLGGRSFAGLVQDFAGGTDQHPLHAATGDVWGQGGQAAGGPTMVIAVAGSTTVVLTALSVVLAFTIFLRDRRNHDRKQVDLLGAWATTSYELHAPLGASGTNSSEQWASATLFVRNASELPVDVVQVACKVHTCWVVPDRNQSSGITEPGKEPDRFFVEPGLIPPQETWTHNHEFNTAHQAPHEDCRLMFTRGVVCEVDWILAVDNAQRTWEIRPRRGRRAKRIRWYSHRREYQPREW